MEEIRGAAGPFADLEVLRQDAGMPVSKFTALLGVPRRTCTRLIVKHQVDNPPKGPWPVPTVEAVEPLVEEYAQDWPAGDIESFPS